VTRAKVTADMVDAARTSEPYCERPPPPTKMALRWCRPYLLSTVVVDSQLGEGHLIDRAITIRLRSTRWVLPEVQAILFSVICPQQVRN